MQAIELNSNYDSWFTLVLLFAIVLMAMLKLLKPNQLFGYTIAFFNPGFFQKKAEDYITIFTPFRFTLTIFSIVVFSLLFYSLVGNVFFAEDGFYTFLKVLTFVFCYVFLRYFIDNLITGTFVIRENLNYFLHTKYGYLFTVSLLIFPFIILNQYTLQSTLFLISIFTVLLVFRALLILFNNKRIVISKLFYFILYFCTLEIAPLLILYKITTK